MEPLCSGCNVTAALLILTQGWLNSFTSWQATQDWWKDFITPVRMGGIEVEGEQSKFLWKWSKMFYYCNYYWRHCFSHYVASSWCVPAHFTESWHYHLSDCIRASALSLMDLSWSVTTKDLLVSLMFLPLPACTCIFFEWKNIRTDI